MHAAIPPSQIALVGKELDPWQSLWPQAMDCQDWFDDWLFELNKRYRHLPSPPHQNLCQLSDQLSWTITGKVTSGDFPSILAVDWNCPTTGSGLPSATWYWTDTGCRMGLPSVCHVASQQNVSLAPLSISNLILWTLDFAKMSRISTPEAGGFLFLRLGSLTSVDRVRFPLLPWLLLPLLEPLWWRC